MTRLNDALERARGGERRKVDAADVDAWKDDPGTDMAAATTAVEELEPPPAAVPPPAPRRAAAVPDSAKDAALAAPQSAAIANRFAALDLDDEQAEATPAVDSPYHFARDAAVKLVVGPDPDHTLVEQYRHLCAAMHHAQLKHGVKTVMVTSAVEAEGKTTTAANIALTLSHSHQRRVLLIDADLRRPSLHSVFQIQNRDGLGDYLRDLSPTRKQPAVHSISPRLSMLTAGRPTQDPMGALVSEEMKELISEAAEHFDWVIIDTPPVALLSDANLLSSMIDIAILVVRANSTGYPLVQRAQEAIGADRILGVVLNRARKSDLSVGYGYGYYYYGYSYNPKNAETKPKGLRARLFGRRR